MSNFVSFHFETKLVLKNIYVSYFCLLNLSGTCRFGWGFFLPFSLFISQQAEVKTYQLINRRMLLLLLQSPGESNNLAACSSSQIFCFLTSCWQKSAAGDFYTRNGGKKGGKVSRDFVIVVVKTDVKHKSLLSHPNHQPKAHSVLHELLGQASCTKVAGVLSSSQEWRECGCHGNSNHPAMRGRSERHWIHLQILMQGSVDIEASASLTIVIISINLISQDVACFETTKGVLTH